MRQMIGLHLNIETIDSRLIFDRHHASVITQYIKSLFTNIFNVLSGLPYRLKALQVAFDVNHIRLGVGFF